MDMLKQLGWWCKIRKLICCGSIAPGAGRKKLGLYLGFKGGVRVELGGVRVVGS